MQNSTTPILDSVIADQKWDPFDESQREVFEDRNAREMHHYEWIDHVFSKVLNASEALLKKHSHRMTRKELKKG